MLLFAAASVLYGQITVHVQNPWRSDASGNTKVNIVGGVQELGNTTWAGDAKPMYDEGNSWFSYTFTVTQKSSTVNLQIVKPFPANQNWNWTGKSIGSLSTLFAGATKEQVDVWVLFDAAGKMTVTLDPAKAGALSLFLLNPFPENSPTILIGTKAVQMQLSGKHQGWYVTYYMGNRDNFSVSFRDYFSSQWFNSDGGKKSDNSAAPINLTPYKDAGNTLYIWPQPAPAGKPQISAVFPGILGDSPFRTITALVRDQKSGAYKSATAPSGEFEGGFKNDPAIKGMVQNELSSLGKIQRGSKSYFSDSLEKWFENKITPANKTNDTCINIELTKSNDGGWSFNSDANGGFYPIDNFNRWGDSKITDDKGVLRNFGFTMELRTEFDYHEGRGQTFYFSGDDDVWVFVNGKLVIDLGGPHPAIADSINLDNLKTTLGLVDGSVNRLDMFYCERQSNGSNFRMRTTLNIENSNSLLLDTIKGGQGDHYVVKEKTVGEFGNDCGINIYNPEETKITTAHVTFRLYGDQFGTTGTALSTNSVSWGGITVKGDTAIVIDTSAITGLALGKYYIIGENANFYATQPITFTVKSRAPLSADTANVKISSLPEEVRYSTVSLNVNLSSDADCKVFYSIQGGSSGSFDGKGTVTVSGDTVIMTAYAEGASNQFKSKSEEKVYRFIRDLPIASLYLNDHIQNIDLPSAVEKTIVFDIPTLPVKIELKDASGNPIVTGNVKIYFAQKGAEAKIGTSQYSAPFSLSAGDTIRAVASVDGFKTAAQAYWILKQDLPDSRLLAFQGTAESKKADEVNVFTTPTEKITLKLIGPKDEPIILGTATKIWYTTGDVKPEIGKSKEYSDALGVVLTKSDTVRAIAEVYGYDAPIEGRWFYIQDLPEAQIVATPSETFPTPYSFTSSKMAVTLKVIGSDGAEIPMGPKCTIKYALKNGDPTAGTVYSGTPITLTGNDTLRAYADLSDFEDLTGIWAYKQELKTADLIAEPGSAVSTKPYEYPTGSMSVKLKTSSGDTIYYHIASTGPKVIAVKDSATVVITGNDTIWAYADGTESNRRDTVWTYESKLPAANLTADPSKSPVMYFGHTVKVVLNSTNADTIRYTRDGSVPTETSNLFVPGKDTIRILNTDRDTVIISGYAYGKDLAPTKASWTYVRDTLPILKADPAGKKFTNTLDVKLSFSKAVDPDWKNVRIYYTLDGTVPDTTDLLYSGSVKIDTTAVLKARAYADNRIESPVLTEQYTEAAEAVTAWYLDESGDGAIDAAQIVLSKSVTVLPDSLTLLSPFDSTEKRVVLKADLTLADRNVIRAELKKPFTFTGSTIFKPAVLGTMNGEEYLPNSPVTIADSIAPVLIRAEYSFGLITAQEPVIVRAKDTLEVTFSEPVTIGSLKEPFALKHLGAPYSLILADGAKVAETALFVVDSVKDAESPVPGDSIHIDPRAGVTGTGRVQNNADNRWIAVIVNRPPHALTILAITPSNPTKDTIAKGLEPKIYRGSTASIIVADFMMKLWETDGMKAQVVILDPLGNVVAKSGALGSGEGLVSELRSDPRTQIVIYWDGRNQAGRRVGSGIYLARVEITDPYGTAVREMVQIAVTKDSE